MMWDEVIERVMALLAADPAIAAIYGDSIRAAGSGAQEVAGLEWHLIGDTENELWTPIIVQLDQWTRTPEDGRRSERRLRSLLHADIMLELNGVKMFGEYEDGSVLASPDRAGFYGRAVRFRLTPLRRQYALREHA